MILAVRSMDGISNKLKILVGGYPFKIAKELWKSVGADGFAYNATDAVGLANRLILAS
jgi:methanogenic corrinoid protein MtbC1